MNDTKLSSVIQEIKNKVGKKWIDKSKEEFLNGGEVKLENGISFFHSDYELERDHFIDRDLIKQRFHQYNMSDKDAKFIVCPKMDEFKDIQREYTIIIIPWFRGYNERYFFTRKNATQRNMTMTAKGREENCDTSTEKNKMASDFIKNNSLVTLIRNDLIKGKKIEVNVICFENNYYRPIPIIILDKTAFVNVHLQSAANNTAKRTFQMKIIQTRLEALKKSGKIEKSIIAGDFNMKENELNKTFNSLKTNTQKLYSVVSSHGLPINRKLVKDFHSFAVTLLSDKDHSPFDCLITDGVSVVGDGKTRNRNRVDHRAVSWDINVLGKKNIEFRTFNVNMTLDKALHFVDPLMNVSEETKKLLDRHFEPDIYADIGLFGFKSIRDAVNSLKKRLSSNKRKELDGKARWEFTFKNHDRIRFRLDRYRDNEKIKLTYKHHYGKTYASGFKMYQIRNFIDNLYVVCLEAKTRGFDGTTKRKITLNDNEWSCEGIEKLVKYKNVYKLVFEHKTKQKHRNFRENETVEGDFTFTYTFGVPLTYASIRKIVIEAKSIKDRLDEDEKNDEHNSILESTPLPGIVQLQEVLLTDEHMAKWFPSSSFSTKNKIPLSMCRVLSRQLPITDTYIKVSPPMYLRPAERRCWYDINYSNNNIKLDVVNYSSKELEKRLSDRNSNSLFLECTKPVRLIVDEQLVNDWEVSNIDKKNQELHRLRVDAMHFNDKLEELYSQFDNEKDVGKRKKILESMQEIDRKLEKNIRHIQKVQHDLIERMKFNQFWDSKESKFHNSQKAIINRNQNLDKGIYSNKSIEDIELASSLDLLSKTKIENYKQTIEKSSEDEDAWNTLLSLSKSNDHDEAKQNIVTSRTTVNRKRHGASIDNGRNKKGRHDHSTRTNSNEMEIEILGGNKKRRNDHSTRTNSNEMQIEILDSIH